MGEPEPEHKALTTEELIELVNQDIGRAVPCPCCGDENWEVLTDTPFAVGLLAAARPAGSETNYAGGFFGVGFFCERCGSVRFHTVGVDQATGRQLEV